MWGKKIDEKDGREGKIKYIMDNLVKSLTLLVLIIPIKKKIKVKDTKVVCFEVQDSKLKIDHCIGY